MINKITTVFGVYANRKGLEAILDRMRAAGFANTGVSTLIPEEVDAGTVVEGALGWLQGTGVLSPPGMGRLLAAGPIIDALAGTAERPGAGVAEALVELGLSESDARRYERHLKAARILLIVQCEKAEWAVFAKDMLKNSGALDVTSNPEPIVPLRRPLTAGRRP